MSKDETIKQALALVADAEAKLTKVKSLLSSITDDEDFSTDYSERAKEIDNFDEDEEDGQVVEGIFNGQTMVDKTGKDYPVPANYASKSKLVPGDQLKLTIKDDGSFLYKQIGPVERKRVIGTLTYEDGQYKVIASGKAYKVLLASVTYFRGNIGDKVTLVIPADEESEWGSIEHIIPGSELNTL